MADGGSVGAPLYSAGVSKEDLQAKLEQWLETSGRALELRTARMFRGQPSARLINQSMAYEDVNTKQQREGDVLAVYHWITTELAVAVEVAAECKSAKANPWVAFYDDRHVIPDDSDYWFLTAGEWPRDYLDRLVGAWQMSSTLTTDRVATHAVSAFGKDSNNQCQDAAQQALSFARARGQGPTRYMGDPEELTCVTAVLPVVVTAAPLFTCELANDGEVVLTPVERFDMWIHLEKYEKRRVYVRSEAGLKEMADALHQLRLRLGGS